MRSSCPVDVRGTRAEGLSESQDWILKESRPELWATANDGGQLIHHVHVVALEGVSGAAVVLLLHSCPPLKNVQSHLAVRGQRSLSR